MSLEFDATMKDLGRDHPVDMLITFDRPPTVPLRLLTPDLSTVTTSADLILGLGDPLEAVKHIDFQSAAAAWKHASTLVYNSLLYSWYHVPVFSTVVLLRPKAAHSNLNGVVSYSLPGHQGSMNFVYNIVRLWERPAESLLLGPIGTAPLSLLGALPQGVSTVEALTTLAQRLIDRLERETDREQAKKLLTAAYVLTGLRVDRDVAREVFQGVRAMRDSDTYLAILDEGREEGRLEGEVKQLKRTILRFGGRRFGVSDAVVTERLNGITDPARLERIHDRIMDAADWQDLLDTP